MSTATIDLQPLLDRVREEYLRRMTQGRGHLLLQVEQYVASQGGKMLRPRITLAAAATLGPEALHSRRTLLLAVAVEMLHNASLIHDDVIDHSPQRRGRPSVNARWNNGIAVLLGDYHLAHIMQLLDEVGDAEASRLINQTVISMVESELLQQELLAGRTITEEDYLTVIDGKTANLFATAAALGNPAYRQFGLHYGRLFQLRDDLDDHETTQWTSRLIEQEQLTLASMQEKLDI